MYAPGLEDIKQAMEETQTQIHKEQEQRQLVGDENGREDFETAENAAISANQSLASVDAEDITGFSFYPRAMFMNA